MKASRAHISQVFSDVCRGPLFGVNFEVEWADRVLPLI